jgi:hypothetical protein
MDTVLLAKCSRRSVFGRAFACFDKHRQLDPQADRPELVISTRAEHLISARGNI